MVLDMGEQEARSLQKAVAELLDAEAEQRVELVLATNKTTVAAATAVAKAAAGAR